MVPVLFMTIYSCLNVLINIAMSATWWDTQSKPKPYKKRKHLMCVGHVKRSILSTDYNI